jgi:hypothetical protein
MIHSRSNLISLFILDYEADLELLVPATEKNSTNANIPTDARYSFDPEPWILNCKISTFGDR